MKSQFKNPEEMRKFKKRMKQVAQKYIRKLKKNRHIIGIAFDGSIVHGRVTKNSDIDIYCFYEPAYFKKEIEGKKEFYDIIDKSGFIVQINNISIELSDKNIFHQLLNNSHEEWVRYKNHCRMLLPVYDPLGKIAAFKRRMSKIYDEELAYILPIYLKEIALTSSAIRKFSLIPLKKNDELIKNIFALRCVYASLYATYLANRKLPPYQNPLFKFEISSLKNKPLSLCSLLEKGSKDYTGIALKIADETLGMFIPIAQDLCRKVGVKLYNNEDYLKIDAYAISQYVKEEFLHAIEADLGILKRRELLKKKCLYDYYAFALRKNIYDEMARTKDQAKIEKKIEELIKILRIGLKNNFDNKDILKGELADVLNKKAALPFLNIRERIKAEEEAREIRNTIKNYNTDPNLIRKKIEEYELLMRELKLKTNDKLTITKIKNYIRILKEDLRKNKNREALTKKLGIIKIRNVKFLNKKMYPSHIFRSGDQMIIKIDYHALRKVENPVFGIAFYSEDGVHIAGPNTRFSGLKIKYVKGKGSVFFKINKLPLLEGKYFVTVAVHPYKSFEPYDVHIKRYSFKVVDSPPEPGFLHLDSEWIISKQKQ